MKKNNSQKIVLITAGPTREYLDPVRFLSNESSGTVGYELAREAKRLGYQVIFVVGPTHLPTIVGVETISFVSAQDLLKILKVQIKRADIFFMAAAVADFTPSVMSRQKIKRGDQTDMTIALKANPDILKMLSDFRIKKNKIYVGFCIETENVRENAQKKMQAKHLDFIVASCVSRKQSPFGANIFQPMILKKDGREFIFETKSKRMFARKMFRLIKPKEML